MHRIIRNINLVMNSVRNFTNWETMQTTFDILFPYSDCNSLMILVPRYGLEMDDFGTDLMRFDDTY